MIIRLRTQIGICCTFSPMETLANAHASDALGLPLLAAEQIARISMRLACQIWEANYYVPRLYLAGITGQGDALAARIEQELTGFAPSFVISRCSVQVDKRASAQPVVVLGGAHPTDVDNATVVLIDDVLNSGRTLAYAMAPFLARPLQALQVAVLVERSHRTYPVSADFSGLKLATSLEQHVEVRLVGEVGAWIN